MFTQISEESDLSKEYKSARKHEKLSKRKSDYEIRSKLRNNSKYQVSIIDPAHRSCSPVWFYIIFILIAITIGVIVVCLTSPKTTKTSCGFNFKQTKDISIGYDSTPQSLAVGDFNHDNNLDLVIANTGTSTIGIFLGYKNGTFAEQIKYSTGDYSQPYSVAVEDFNKDNHLDIVVTNYGTNNIGLFLGYGNGSFQTQRTFSLNNSHPMMIAVGDLNKDNQSDLVVSNYGTANIAILYGYVNGSFELNQTIDMGYDSFPYALALQDFDNDTNLDIAIANYGTNNLIILLSDGNLSFIKHTYETGNGSNPHSIAVGYLDGDGVIDIAVANSGSNTIGLFFGNKNGTFQDMISYSIGTDSRPNFLTIIDFNNDSLSDIIIANSDSHTINLFKGHKNRTFTLLMTYSTGSNTYPYSIVVQDFDKDNQLDLAVANKNTGTILILTSYGLHQNITQTTYTLEEGAQPYSISVNDVNNDNYLDIIVGNAVTETVIIFINNGNGLFQIEQIISMTNNSGTYFVSAGDFNNDQQIDIVVVLNYLNQIEILFGSGNGTFQYGINYSTGNNSAPESVAVGDINNDNNLDIIVSNFGSGNLGLFFGYGNGTFRSIQTILSDDNVYPTCVRARDINNDNITDIITADSVNALGVITLIGYGNGSFQQPIFSKTHSVTVNRIFIYDINRDNLMDVVYCSIISNTVGVMFGFGNGSFEYVVDFLTNDNFKPWFIGVSDLNNDGWPDITVGNAYTSSVHIYISSKNGSYTSELTLNSGYGSGSYSIAFGDFNNDNLPDMVVGNAEVGNINVFLIDYILTFANQTSYYTGSGPHPYSIYVSDINNDHYDEIIVADSNTDDLRILLDYQEEYFYQVVKYYLTTGSHPQYVTLADFNNDHQLDIAVANTWKDNINIFLKIDNQTFDSTPSIHSTGSDSGPNSISTGDLNNDGYIDMVVTNQNQDNIGIFLGYDYTTFRNKSILIYAALPKPYHIAVGDFNKDLNWDFVVANSATNNITIHLGYGNGTFAREITYRTGQSSNPIFVAVADFNNDNRSDIVVANYATNDLSLFLGYGNGSFNNPKLSELTNISYPVSIAVGDLNNDHCLDMIVANKYSDQISIILGYGNGSFHIPIIYFLPQGSTPTYVLMNDLNNDSRLDILVCNYDGDNIRILLGYGNGTFKDYNVLSTGSNSGPYEMTMGDINNDKCFDIAVINQRSKTIGLFFGYCNGNFSNQKTISTGTKSYVTSILVGKLNNDTYLDIAITDWGAGHAYIGILFGFGNGNFTLMKTYQTSYYANPTSIVMADFNNDHYSDLAITNFNRHTITIMFRSGSEPFATQTNIYTGNSSQPSSVTTGYFNNDKVLDLAIANSGADSVGIFLGYGDGSFSSQDLYSLAENSKPQSIATADFDHDGKLDVIVANYGQNNFNIYFGYSNRNFTSLQSYVTGEDSNPFAIHVVDLNKDNNTDIIVANYGINNILIYLGFGNGTFVEYGEFPLGFSARPVSIGAGDFNNDNLTDIAIANYGADYIDILEQTC